MSDIPLQQQIEDKPKYEVSITWWMGFWALIPVRLLFGLVLFVGFVIMPSVFYFIAKSALFEEDQSKWRL